MHVKSSEAINALQKVKWALSCYFPLLEQKKKENSSKTAKQQVKNNNF